ncbi:Aste57867_13181 [Aphanomyces stellatus]|uniref:Aste57867_13181 protein n=1 Tax=Aphanomyces stellatus TaxID=120398 RepID=A0A485KXH2_9STRA|nr:hypothetical protein As57867_013132 [Aphanomyces stellatus]VFT90022.1 Aste57867_13181 [Aphanomyces stellatus]
MSTEEGPVAAVSRSLEEETKDDTTTSETTAASTTTPSKDSSTDADDVGEIAPMEDMAGPPLDVEALEVGYHFQDVDYFIFKVQKYAQEKGFVVCKDGKFFSWRNPHPVHPENYKLLQRTTIYCNVKDPAATKKTLRFTKSCPWKIRVLYDRGTLDYMVTEVTLTHNHGNDATSSSSPTDEPVIDLSEAPSPHTGGNHPGAPPPSLVMGRYRIDNGANPQNAPSAPPPHHHHHPQQQPHPRPTGPSGRGAKRPFEPPQTAQEPPPPAAYARHLASRRPHPQDSNNMGRDVRGHAIPSVPVPHHGMMAHPPPPYNVAPPPAYGRQTGPSPPPHSTGGGRSNHHPYDDYVPRGSPMGPPPMQNGGGPPPHHYTDVYAQETNLAMKRHEMEMQFERERQQMKDMELRREMEKQRYFIELQQHDRQEKEAVANQRVLDAKAKEAELSLKVAKLKAKQELINAGVPIHEIDRALEEL